MRALTAAPLYPLVKTRAHSKQAPLRAPARPWQGRRRGNLGPGSEAQVGAPQGAGTAVPDSSRLDLVPEFPTAKSPLSRPELSVTSARCFLFPGEELFCSSQFKGRVCASELWASLHASASGARAPSAGARPCGAGGSATASAVRPAGAGRAHPTCADLSASSYFRGQGENDFRHRSGDLGSVSSSPGARFHL